MRKAVIYLFILIAAVFPAASTNVPAVSVIICDAGGDVYELDGHAGLRFRFPNGRDLVVNWGLFDFNSPNFIYRFVKGETDYKVGAIPSDDFVEVYTQENRGVAEYHLNLTDEEALRAFMLVADNLLPQNSVYRYNYVKDNCSTRPMGIIERAVSDTISYGKAAWTKGREVSYRDVMRRFHANYPWYQFGIDLALGSGVDYALSRRQQIFAPVILAEMLPDATVSGRRLVDSVEILNHRETGSAVKGPTPWYLTPLAVSFAVLILSIVFSIRDVRRGRLTGWFDTLQLGIFGLAGLLLTFLIFVSIHEATSPNWLYLWCNPLALVIAVELWIKKAETLVYWCQIANFVALTTLLIIGAVGVQYLNVAFYPLIVSDLLRSIVFIVICRKKSKC